MTSLLEAWTWRMAWRESRRSLRRLFLFLASIVAGVAALVAVQSFGQNLELAVNEQAKSLLGADLAVRSRAPFEGELARLVDSLGGRQSREIRFDSMAHFPANQGTRLVQIRGLEGGFPFYGELETEPAGAAGRLGEGLVALVDDGVMLQYGVEVGDQVTIGVETFTIVGRLKAIPGEALVSSFVSPRIYIPAAAVERTGLVGPASRVSYRVFYRFDSEPELERALAALEPHLARYRLRTDTVEDRKRRLGRALENLYRFLGLVGFIALLLGGIGVASSLHLHVRHKLDTIATLRCLGSRTGQTFSIYVIQSAAMGTAGAALGAALGAGTQGFLPRLLEDFVPFAIPNRVSIAALAEGALVGLGVGLLFALLPLCRVRKVSPLRTLRISFDEPGTGRDPLMGLIVLAIAAATVAFAVTHTSRLDRGLTFAAGVFAAFLMLGGMARLITLLVRRFFPSSWSFVWRQGLANLYRPQNQTVVLMLSLGLGAFLIATLFLTRSTLLRQVARAGGEGKPNIVFFDIQPEQRDRVAGLLRQQGLPLLQSVPIVTMRLRAVGGVAVEELAEDPDSGAARWALMREYRSTYRDALIESERLLEGRWPDPVRRADQLPGVTLEEGIARALGVAAGDSLTFDVQGLALQTVVTGIRQVEWERIQTNFFVVFPSGVLEGAPQFQAFISRVESARASAAVQRAVVAACPNVSIIDFSLILDTVDRVLEKVAFVIQFMALFSIATGVVVLIAAVVNSRLQRAREGVLLRTLGASRGQISRIMAVEYFFLGVFAAATGLLLSLAASWALARFLFETDFTPDPAPVAATLAGVVALTLLVGLWSSRGLCDRPPLEVLRAQE